MRIGCSLINLFLIVVCNIPASSLSNIIHNNTYSRIFVHCPLSLASSAEHSGICFINSTSQAGYLVLEVEKHATVVQISYDSFFFCQNCGIQTLHRNSLSPFECDGSVTLEHLRTNPSLQCKSLISTRNGDEPASFYSRVHLDSSIFKDVSLDDSDGGLVCGRGIRSETVEKCIFHNITLSMDKRSMGVEMGGERREKCIMCDSEIISGENGIYGGIASGINGGHAGRQYLLFSSNCTIIVNSRVNIGRRREKGKEKFSSRTQHTHQCSILLNSLSPLLHPILSLDALSLTSPHLLIMVVQYPSLPLVLSVTHSLSLIVSSLTAFQKVLAGQSTVGMHPHLL